jgi:hypothetical protein
MNSKDSQTTTKPRKPATKVGQRGATAGKPKKKKGPTPTIIPGALE